MAKGLIIGLAVAGAIGIAFVSMFGYASSVQKDGNGMEQQLSAHYQVDQLVLDTGIKELKEQTGLANIQNDRLDKTLSDAMKGQLSAKIDPATGRSAFMLALQTAIPNVDVSIYNKIIDREQAFRENFKQTQTTFRDEIRVYDTWRTEGLIRPMFVRWMGFPSDSLEARIGTQTLHRMQALDQMKVLVTSGETDTAFQTGHEEPINFPGAVAPDKN
jgi:hypothetical protein